MAQSGGKRSGIRRVWMAAIGAGLALTACSEPDVILVGDREDLRDGALVSDLPTAPLDRPIRLPSQSANTDWPAGIGTSRAAHAALSAAPQRVWTTRIGEGNSRRNKMPAPPVVGGGMIFTLDARAQVSAVTPTGEIAWQFDIAEHLNERGKISGGGLAWDKGVLYVTSAYGAVVALEAKSGATRWVQKLGATGGGSPLVRGNLLYIMAGDDAVWALRTDTGRIAWQLDGTGSPSNILGAPAPVSVGGLVVFAYGTGDVLATFPQGGLVRWNANVTGQRQGQAVSKISDVTGAPVVSGGRIYAGNHSGRIVALDAATGERLWTAREGAMDPVWPVGGSLFAVSDTNQLLRINAGDGAVIWAADLPGYVTDKPRRRGKQYAHFGPILAGGWIIVASTDGLMRFFDPATGAVTRTVEVPGGAASAAVVAGQTLYVMGGKGDLHAFR